MATSLDLETKNNVLLQNRAIRIWVWYSRRYVISLKELAER